MDYEKKKRWFLKPLTQAALEKVVNMVGTFITDSRDSFQISTIKKEPEKVTNMVGTFLDEESDSFQVLASKMEPKR